MQVMRKSEEGLKMIIPTQLLCKKKVLRLRLSKWRQHVY
jgi:hypothetical protein